jgi:hypothetical protein
MNENVRSSVLSYFARSLGLQKGASQEEIEAKIASLPENGMVHPQDLMDTLHKMLSGELPLPQTLAA